MGPARQGLIIALAALSALPAIAESVSHVERHHRLSVLLALHYCEVGEWPESIDALHRFHLDRQDPNGAAHDWAWLHRHHVKLELGEHLRIRSTHADLPDTVVSEHHPPQCLGDRPTPVTAVMVAG